jgi:arsenate reductase (glutaredoxin)
MIQMYHNNRCGKSRCALQALEATQQPFEVIEYLKTPLDADALRHLLTLLNKKPLEIIRQKEAVFQEQFKGKNLSDEAWIEAMVAHPVLMERPIVVAGGKAWIARDAEGLDAIEALR